VTKVRAALALLVVVMAAVGASTAEAHRDGFCVLTLWGPTYERLTGRVYGGAHAICTGEAHILISGVLTKRSRVKDSDVDICNSDNICSVSMSAPRGRAGKLWHVYAYAVAEAPDGHRQRDPNRGWKRSDCKRF
jgi:hypothetical protein